MISLPVSLAGAPVIMRGLYLLNMKGKLYLVAMRPTAKTKFVITLKGVYEFICTNADGSYELKSLTGDKLTHYGKVYQMAAYLGENSVLVEENQWRLCTKYIPRIDGKLVVGLTNNGVIHKNHQPITFTIVGDVAKIFK